MLEVGFDACLEVSVNNIYRRGDEFEVEGVVAPNLIEKSCSACQFVARAEAGDNRRRRMQAQDSTALAALTALNTILVRTTNGKLLMEARTNCFCCLMIRI